MAVDEQIRKELTQAIRKACKIPWKNDREKLLWDALQDIATNLGYEIIKGEFDETGLKKTPPTA